MTAVAIIIKIPYLVNNDFVNSNFSTLAKFSISHIPTVSNNQSPIIYAIAPPIMEPSVAAKTIGRARFLSATIAGVIKTSGGTKRNIDSHTVIKNTTHAYQGCDDLSKTLFMIFIMPIIDDLKNRFNIFIIFLVFFIYQCIIAARD